MNRIDRLFGILLRLQHRRRIRAQDLARHFEVSERTIYRDIAALNELGVPIISLPNAGYELPEGFALPPLFFTSGEAGALALAIRLLLAQTTGATNQDAERALAKISVVLPRATREHIDALGAIIQFYAHDRAFDLDDPRLMMAQQAIAGRLLLELRYHSYRANEQLTRVVEPDSLTYHQGCWYLEGYCRLRQASRSFRLDRIDQLRALDDTFTPRSATRAQTQNVLVRVRFHPAITRWVHERQHFGFMAQDGDLYCYEVDNPLVMLPWILSWGANAEVIEPANLRARVREEIQQLLEILT